MNYSVKVNGQEKDIHWASVNPVPYNENKKQEYVIFSMSGKAEIEISSVISVESVVVRPLSAKIDFTFSEHSIKISLNAPSNFSVEINGSIYDNLLVFASPEKEYDFKDKKVLGYPKGVHEVGRITIKEDNTVLYLEEGAYLHGKLEVNNCKNILICGNGVISEKDMNNNGDRICVDILGVSDIEIQDITIAESLFWCLRLLGCDNVHIDNVRIIGYRGNNDGIDVCGSRNVTVENVFTRTFDDSFVVKGFDERDKKSVHVVFEGSGIDVNPAFERLGDCENITFKNSVLWNDFARPIELGVSLRCDKVHNITFENIDILHSTTGYPIMGIHHGDRAEIYDVLFSDIRIEDAPGAQIFDIRITDSEWNTDIKKGSIHDITFKNIDLVGKPGLEILPDASRLEGFSAENSIKNVTFENIILTGKKPQCIEDCNIQIMDYVENVKFIPGKGEILTPVKTELTVSEEFKLSDTGRYCGKFSVRLSNHSKAEVSGKIWLSSAPKNAADLEGSILNYKLGSGESIEREIKADFPVGKHLVSIDSDDMNVSPCWRLMDFPWIVKGDIEDAYKYDFVNYYGDRREGIKLAVKDGRLILKGEKNKELNVYVTNPVPVRQGEVLFTVEESDFGLARAVTMGKNHPVSAPQLRCPAEITYVFHNEPKVSGIVKKEIKLNNDGICEISLKELGITSNRFRIELSYSDEILKKYRYPLTLGHSVDPEHVTHMYIDVLVCEE